MTCSAVFVRMHRLSAEVPERLEVAEKSHWNRRCPKPSYSATGSHTGLIVSPVSSFRTNGTESRNDAFSVAP